MKEHTTLLKGFVSLLLVSIVWWAMPSGGDSFAPQLQLAPTARPLEAPMLVAPTSRAPVPTPNVPTPEASAPSSWTQGLSRTDVSLPGGNIGTSGTDTTETIAPAKMAVGRMPFLGLLFPQRPLGIFWDDQSQQLFVADTIADRIVVLDSSLKPTNSFGAQIGEEFPAVKQPLDVAVSNSRCIYVANSAINRVSRFKLDETNVVQAEAQISVNSPGSLAVRFKDDVDHVYVTDTSNKRIFYFQSNCGNLDHPFSPSVPNASIIGWKEPFHRELIPFGSPEGLALDDSVNLYVVDSELREILKIGFDLTLLKTIADSSKLSTPAGIALGPNGSVFVADANGVKEFKADGTMQVWTAEDSGVFYDVAVAAHSDGSLTVYASDTDHNRIRILEPLKPKERVPIRSNIFMK
jgi:DNA-binding beta-propeller fold protein YncE